MSDDPLYGKTKLAFELYCRDSVVQSALASERCSLNLDLLRDCFMAGAKYATDRCKESGHGSAP